MVYFDIDNIAIVRSLLAHIKFNVPPNHPYAFPKKMKTVFYYENFGHDW